MNLFRKLFKKKLNLIDLLPPIQGKILPEESLAKKTWLGVGGPAQVYIEPASVDDLALLLRFMPNVPLTLLGAGSNMLVRDGGIAGVVVHLGAPFSKMKFDKKENLITCGAGALVMELSKFAQQNGMAGFEFLCGIPGSVGGGIRMNAGAYGRSFQDILVSLKFMNDQGDVREIHADETDMFAYRKCFLPADWIFLEATFRGTPCEKTIIAQRMADYKQKRKSSQPIGVKTAGSTFKNPDGLTAWKLIDQAGMRGYVLGGAKISEKHSNFLVNFNQATAHDLESLGNLVRQKVWETSGVELEWEVKRIGVDKNEKNG